MRSALTLQALPRDCAMNSNKYRGMENETETILKSYEAELIAVVALPKLPQDGTMGH